MNQNLEGKKRNPNRHNFFLPFSLITTFRLPPQTHIPNSSQYAIPAKITLLRMLIPRKEQKNADFASFLFFFFYPINISVTYKNLSNSTLQRFQYPELWNEDKFRQPSEFSLEIYSPGKRGILLLSFCLYRKWEMKWEEKWVCSRMITLPPASRAIFTPAPNEQILLVVKAEK